MVNLHSRLALCLCTAGWLVALVEGVCLGVSTQTATRTRWEGSGSTEGRGVCVGRMLFSKFSQRLNLSQLILRSYTTAFSLYFKLSESWCTFAIYVMPAFMIMTFSVVISAL